MESEAMCDQFVDRGVVRVDGALDADTAAAMRDVLWRYAGKKIGVRPDDPATWPSTGWLPMSWKGLKRNRALNAVTESAAVAAALDAIFAATGWETTRSGPQILFTLPTAGPWQLPDGWHTDCGFDAPTWPVGAVKMFVCIGEVAPLGGGTLLLPGVHQLVDRYRNACESPASGGKQHWAAFLRRHPPLGELLTASARPDRGRSLIGQRFNIDGVDVDVEELTGAPGDIVIAHMHVFHVAAPNTTSQARVMLGQMIRARS
jgi:ectoine hydroxylase-related dioxygenase (phytanoyl-CoA dioxygenase family)